MLAKIPIQKAIEHLDKFLTHCPMISSIGITLDSRGYLMFWFLSKTGLDVIYYPERQILIIHRGMFWHTPVEIVASVLRQYNALPSPENEESNKC